MMKKLLLPFILIFLFIPFSIFAASAAGTGEADYPRLLGAAPTASGLTVKWSAYPGAARYRLYYRDAGRWVRIGDTTATSYTHSGLTNHTSYCYTVRAINSSGAYGSEFDPVGLTATFFSVPALRRASNELNGQRVSWGPVEGVEKYRVYLKTGTSWRSVATVKGTSFLNENVSSGVTYTYTVRCYSSDGATALSYFDRAGISATYSSSPVITACTPVDGGNKLTWIASPGASVYRLSIKDAGGITRTVDTTATAYTHSGLLNNTTYTYSVRAYDSAGVSSADSEAVTATYHSVPRLNRPVSVYGGQQVSWTAVPGAVNYKIYVKRSSGWSSVGTSQSASFVYRGAQSGESYTYTVRCCTADGAQWQSYFDKKGVSAVYYASPEITRFTPLENGTRITWSPVAGAVRYRLFRRTESGWKTIVTTGAYSANRDGVTDRETTTYTVRALDSSGAYISGYRPDGWQNTYYAPPEFTDVRYDGGYTLRWNKPEGVIGWQLYRSTPGGERKLILNTRKRTSFTDTTAAADIPYAYALCCVNRNEDPVSAFTSDMIFYLNGAPADGALEWDGRTLSFENGYLRHGYVTVDGKQYYYNSAGVMMKNGIVGSERDGYTYADENGVCCVSDEIRMAAEFMMKHAEGSTLNEKMKTGYLYLAHQFPYNRTYDHPKQAADLPALAIDMFRNERGNCYRYAACFACIAKIAGYRVRVVLGTTIGNPHGWVEVLVDGEWLICDPDADIPAHGRPDYSAYMMEKHFWQLTPKTRCELTIDENGAAVWE